MATQSSQSSKADKSAVAEGKSLAADSRRNWALILAILGLLALALGFKAWEEHQTAERNFRVQLEAEAHMLASRISARADAAQVMLSLVGEAGMPKSQVASLMPGIDALVSLRDAALSPPGYRLGDAAAAARSLKSGEPGSVLTAHGDLVFVWAGENRDTLIALSPVSSVFKKPDAARLSFRSHDKRFSFGAASLSEAAEAAPAEGSAIQTAPDGVRAASACAMVGKSDVSVCLTVVRPLLSLADIARFAIFSLLIAAPSMALVGLTRRLSKRQTERLIQATRNQESDRLLGLVMRGAKAGYWEWSHATNAIFFSDGAASLLSLERQGLLTLDDLLARAPLEANGRIREAFDTARTIGWIHLTFPVSALQGRWIEMRGSLSTDPITGNDVFGGIMLDVTDRKQAEDRVRAAERRLRFAIEGFTGPFALWDSRRRLLYWNRAFALDFGLQDTLRAGLSHETMQIARSGAVLLERVSAEDSRTTLIALRSGRWLKLVERSTPDGGLLTVGVDVTENVRNEEELKKQQAKVKRAALDLERSEGKASELTRKYSEEKEKAEHAAATKAAFLGNMSHELRTPLNAIVGFSEIMMNELAGPLGHPSYKEYSSDILASGQHLLDMINDILDMAKIEAGKMTITPQPIDPVDPVDAALRMIRRKAEEKDIDLVLDADLHLPDIDADHRAIRQMILNLVSNSIKFTDRGGKITVRVEQRGPMIQFSVTDTGIGIPAEDLPRLGQPFEQVAKTKDRNTDGTGLGLALAKSFAEMHGGRMTLASIYGEGTTVAFTLPIGGPENLEDGMASRDVA
ncbi:PAS domain-containing sensor histidine kinase [Hyphomonas sp.]|uniref:sensor histidine kinase n=1 Tax=Hyphomonas sp. TaxID=87 RepID=UPI0033429DF9